MPSALEAYYRSKAKKKDPDENTKKKAAEEFLGIEDIVKKKSPGFFVQLLDLLDRPGNAVRALLVGKLGGLKGLIPFAQTIEDLTGIDVALNPDERVMGTDVIEKWFGKQKQRRGKIDPVDVYGFLIEVVADPLWLLWGPGLTKLGKAGQLVRGGAKQAIAAKNLVPIKAAIRAAKAGNPIEAGISRKLANAIRTVYKSGQGTKGIFKAKTWAEQAALGHRAILQVGLPGRRKVAIKGIKVIGKAEKLAVKIRKGYIGTKLLSPTRKVSPRFEELHDIAVHLARDMPAVEKKEWLVRFKGLYDRILKEGISEKNLTDFIEANYANADELIAAIRVKRAKIAAPRIARKQAQVKGLLKRKETRTARLLKAQPRVAAGIKGELRFIDTEIKKARKAIDRWEKFPQKNISRIETLKAREAQLLQQADEILGSVPPEARKEFRSIAKTIHGYGEKMLETEIKAGIPIGRLGETIAHARRNITPEFHKFIKKNPRFGSAKEFSVRAGTQTKRQKFLAGLTRDEVDDYFFKKGFKGKKGEQLHVYDPSVTQASFIRASESAKVMGSAKTIKASIRKFSAKVVPEGEDWIPVEKLIEETGLIYPAGSFKGQFIPREIADALTATHTIARTEEFSNLVTSINRFYKGSFTMYWPAYHGRNAISNVFLNWIAGVKNPQSYLDAFRLQRAANKTRKLTKTGISWDAAAARVNWPVVTTGAGQQIPGHQFYQLAEKWGILGQSLGEMGIEEIGTAAVVKAKGFFTRVGKHQTIVGRGARNVSLAVENNARLAHFLEKSRHGFDPASAARSAKKVLFDYGDLSEFEKKFMRDKVFLFYTFARKNLPLQVQTLIQQPAKQAIFAHAAGGVKRMQEEAPYYKDWQQEKLMIPTPFRTKEGQQYVIKGTGLPIEEAFGPLAAPGVGFADRLRRFGSRQAARLIPAIKTPMEFVTGHELFFDRPIRDYGSWAKRQLPTSRAGGAVRQWLSPYEETASKISGYATGIRFQPYDPAKQREMAARDIVMRYLARQKGVRRFKRYYLPKEEREKAKAEIQRFLAYQRK